MKNKRKANLPGLPVLRSGNPATDAWASKVNEHLETRMGARGDDLERVVTFRDLEELASQFVTVGGSNGGSVSNKDGYLVDLGGGRSAFVDFKGFLDALTASALWRDFFKRLTDPSRFDDLPEKVRAILQADLSEEAARRGADVRRLEEKLQSQLSSLAYSVTEITAGVAGSSAGVREALYASATANRATAGKVTQVVAALAGTGAAAFEQQILVIADRIEGLRSQYTIKLSAGGAMAGFGIAVEQNGANAPASSAFLIQADRFAIVSPSYNGGPTVTPDPSQVPFGVDATGVYINGNVRINASGMPTIASIVEPKGIVISADSQFFKRESSGTTFTPASITLRAIFTGTVTGTVTWFRGTTQVATNTMTYTVNPGDFATDTQAYSAQVTFNGITYQDFITIVKLRDGADSLTALLTNESHTVASDANGNNVNYAGASGQMQVFRGSTRLTSGVTYSVVAAQTSGFSPAPTINPDGTYSITAGLTADVGTVTFRADVGGTTVDKVFTLTKARQGVGGAAGTSTVIVYAYKRSAAQPTDNPGAYTYTFADNTTTPATLANGWTRSIPSGTDPVWVVASTPSGTGPTANVTAAQWSTPPTQLVKDGAPGANGLQAATVFIYVRTNGSTAPTITAGSSTYTFSSGTLSNPPTGVVDGSTTPWSTSVPATGGPYLWVAQATATATAPATTDVIDFTEFAPSVRLLSTSVRDLTLVASSQTFKYDTTGAASPAAQTITFTAVATNLPNDRVWSTSPPVTLGTTANANERTLSIAAPGFGANTSVEVTVTQGGLTDKVTVYRLQDGAVGQTGAGGIVGYLTNPYINVPAASDGSGTVFTNATGTFEVYQGTARLTSGLTFQVSGTPVNLSTVSINSTTGAYSIGGMSADSGTATFRVTASSPPLDISRTVTVNKVKQGQQGNSVQGPTGARGNITVYLSGAQYNSSTTSTTFSTDATNAVRNEAAARGVPVADQAPKKGDEAYFNDGSNTFARLYIFNGTAWALPGVVIDGSLLVTGTVAGAKLIAGSVTADRLNTNGLEIKDAAGNVVLRSGNVPINALPSFNSIRAWNFDAAVAGVRDAVTTLDDWKIVDSTATALASSLRITCGADQQFISPVPLYIEGARYDRVQVRLRRLAGAVNTTWDGKLYYRGPSGIYITAPLTAPVNNDPNATTINVGGPTGSTTYKVGLGVSAGSTFIPLVTLGNSPNISAITPGQSVTGPGVPPGATVRSVTTGISATSEQAVQQIADPTALASGGWVTAEWDMSSQPPAQSTAGAWVNQFIADIRLDFGTTGAQFEVDWVAIGRNVAGGPDRITPENASTFIDALSVNTLQIAGNAVTIPTSVVIPSGQYSGQVTTTYKFPVQAYVLATFTQGANRSNTVVEVLVNGTQISAEAPGSGTTGAMANIVSLPAGAHTFRMQTTAVGDFRGTIIVIGAMK